MRILLVCLTGFLIGNGSGCAKDWTVEYFTRDTDKDGIVDVQIEVTRRGSEKIMSTLRRKIPANRWSTFRFIYVAGDLVQLESDEDGDGMFESVVFYNPGKNEIEMFTRDQTGKMTPEDTEALRKFKIQRSEMNAFWKDFYDSKRGKK